MYSILEHILKSVPSMNPLMRKNKNIFLKDDKIRLELNGKNIVDKRVDWKNVFYIKY